MALGQQARSFGGYFLDGAGAVVVYVADTTEFATARAAVEALLGTDALGLPPSARPARVEVRNGDFSFQQLSDWRDIVSDSLLGQPDVIFDDADEARNRVTIGLDRQNYAAAESQVTASLSRLGIPLNAIHFEPAGRITLATSNTLDTLADSVAGGALIVTGTQSGSAIGSCSLGPVADSVGVLVFFTASHCTSAEYALDHSIASFWTQDVGFPYTKLIGTESGDPVPEGYMCHGWPFNQYCDWSARSTDAALFHIASGSHVRRGLMARPSQRVTHQAGPRSLDSAHPWL